MILLTIQDGDNPRLGVKTARGVIDVATAQAALGQGDGSLPQTVDAVIAGGEPARSALAGLVARTEAEDGNGATWLRDEASLAVGPAVPNPGKIVCVGLNYRKHAEESGAAIPESPVLFSKFSNSVAAPNEDVPLPDSGALSNPLIAGVETLGQLLIGDHPLGQIGAAADELRPDRHQRAAAAGGVAAMLTRSRSCRIFSRKPCCSMSTATPMAFEKPNASVPPWLFTAIPFRPRSMAPL